MSGHYLSRQERTAKVDVDDTAPFIDRVVDRRFDDIDTCIADEMIDTAEILEGAADKHLGHVRIGDIPGYSRESSGLTGREFRYESFESAMCFLLINPVDDNSSTLAE
ncbi:hypothetical protein Z051_03750 [Rhodococcus rhodochrous KG-21]|uniref:Uncharacterized protein n=1 Tax=Rhodococcus rhodochrous KG-21 TaxID=1441923 RepID=A0A0M8PSD5_RHORH|nr:hypothetical protein Z051_03750 [Rhodococcus rhodochrous KG-21]